jgi:hypothetical protein
MVVLPEPVPPEMTMLSVPNLSRSFEPSLRFENLRIVSAGPFRASGGMMALTREPSRRRASTRGGFSSMRRPIGATMRSMA